MLRNINLAPKLIVIGGLLIIVPLLIVGAISINRAGSGITKVTNEEMATRARGIAKLVNSILEEQIKFVNNMAIMQNAIEAALIVDEKGKQAARLELNSLTEHLVKMKNTESVGNHMQVAALVSMDGNIIAANEEQYIDVNINERKYFQTAKAGNSNIGESALNKVTNQPYLSFAAPVKSYSDEIVGVVIYLYEIGFLNDLVKDETIGETGYSFIIDERGLVLAHPDKSLIMETNMSDLKGAKILAKKMMAGKAGVEGYQFEGESKTMGYAPITASGWSVALTLSDSEYLAPVNQIRIFVIVVGFVATLVAVTIFLLFSMSVSKNIKKGVDFASKIAQGDLSATIDIDQKDEIGELATALKKMAGELQFAMTDINSVMNAVKSGDLSQTITADLSGDLNMLKESINDSIAMLSQTIIQVAGNSKQVNLGALELSSSAQSLAAGTTEQAASLEEIASSMSEVDAKTTANDENAKQSQLLIKHTMEVMENANNQMGSMMGSINQMKSTSEKVTKIIKDIDEIAFQTNLLALNAAVEAARAGKYGKGFAVVADEVRNLAVRSADAAKRTAELINSSVTDTEKGVSEAEQTSKTLVAINESISKVSGIIEEIAVSSQDQKAGIKEINSGLTQVNKVIQTNSSISEETASASNELSAQATNLENLMREFILKKQENDFQQESAESEDEVVEHLEITNQIGFKGFPDLSG